MMDYRRIKNCIFEFRLVLWGLLTISLLASGADAIQSERNVQSTYKRAAGEFLIPQAGNPSKNRENHAEPPHLQQLRIAKRSADPLNPETALPEIVKRIRRSPQFFPKANVGIGVNAGRDRRPDGDIGDALEFKRKKSTSGPTTSTSSPEINVGLENLGLGNLSEQFKDLLDNIKEEYKKDLEAAGSDDVESRVANVSDTIKAQVDQIGDRLGLGSLKDLISDGIGQVSGDSGTSKLADEVKAGISKVNDDIKSELDSIASEVKDGIQNGNRTLKDEVKNIGSKVNNKIANTEDAVKAELGNLDDTVNAGIAMADEAVNSELGKVADSVKSGIEMADAVEKSELSKLNDFAKAGLQKTDAAVNAELGKLSDITMAEIKKADKAVNSELGKLDDKVKAGIEKTDEAVNSEASKLSSELGPELSSVDRLVKDKIANSGSAVNSELDKIADEVKKETKTGHTGLGSIADSVKAGLGGLSDKLKTGFLGAGSEAVADIGDIERKIKSELVNRSNPELGDFGFRKLEKVEPEIGLGKIGDAIKEKLSQAEKEIKADLGIDVPKPELELNTGNRDTGRVGGEIGLGNVGGGIELNVPEPILKAAEIGLNVRTPKIIANLGGADAKLEVNGPKLDTSLGKAGTEIDLKLPNNSGINADLGNLGGGVSANLGGLGGKVDVNLPKPEIGVDLGKLSGDIKLDVPKPDIKADLGNIGGKLEVDIPKVDANLDLGLGKIGGELDLNAGKPEIKADLNVPKPVLNTSLGNLGAQVNLNLPGIEATTTTTTTTAKPTTQRATTTSKNPTKATTTAKPTTKATTKPTQAATTTTTTTTTTTQATTTSTSTTETVPAENDSKSTSTTEDSEDYVGNDPDNDDQPAAPTEEPENVNEIQPKSEALTVIEYNVKDGELILTEDYSILEAPKENIGSFVFVKVLGIQEIDEVKEKLSFDMDFTVQWVDTKILAASVADDDNSSANSNDTSVRRRRDTKEAMNTDLETLDPEFINKIWRPDVYMEDLVKVEYPTILGKPVVAFKLNKRTGFFSYTVRMTVTVNCPMSFVYYPADTQRCELRIASYSHPNDELKIDWLQSEDAIFGVQIEDPNHHNFNLKVDNVEKLELMPTLNNPDRSSYDVLRFTIAARRKLGYHITQTYIPSVLHIFVTWLVFLIPYTLYDSRIGTTMTTLLTMTALFSGVRETSPMVSYMKAIDLWMLVCVIFVFLNLVELTVMTWLRTALEAYYKQAEEEDARNTSGEKEREVYMYRGQNGKSLRDPERRNPITIKTIRWFEKLENIFKFFEKYSFRLFILLFILFNVIYWVWLLVCSKYFKWESRDQSEL